MAIAQVVRNPLMGHPNGHYSDMRDLFAMPDNASDQPVERKHMQQANTMHSRTIPFQYPSNLEKYLISPKDYVRQSRGTVDVVVVGAIVMHNMPETTKVLIVKRSRHDYMGSLWEIPGGSCDEDDESILEAAARELQEEAGLLVSGMRDVVEDDHEWFDHDKVWRKMTFLVEVVKSARAATVVGAATTTTQLCSNTLPETTSTPIESGELFLNVVNGTKNKRRASSDLSAQLSSYCDRVDNDIICDKDVPRVTLDPNEHEDFVWATESEVRSDFCEGRALKWTTPEQKAAILRAFDMAKSHNQKNAAR